MKAICKSCGMAYPVEPQFVGYSVTCKSCGAKSVLMPDDIIRDRPRTRAVTEPRSEGIDGLSFALGLILSVVGVVVAAAVGGRHGAKSSLIGMVTGAVVAAAIAVFAALSGS